MSSASEPAGAWKTGPQSTDFFTRTYTPTSTPKATIIFIHGFADHIDRYARFHPLICQHGIALFAIDQRGFGKTAVDVEGHKSVGSTYGRTSWAQQQPDLSWAIDHAKQTFPGIPLFLMGHSMGGGEVLTFATLGEKSAYFNIISSLAGIIATSPLILQTKPKPKLIVWLGNKAGKIFPDMLIPTDVNPNDISHDDAVNEAYMKDPLVKQCGSLRCLGDMLSNGEALLATHYKNWPKSLPLLLCHGTEDKIASCKASQTFHGKINAADKTIKLFDGCFHELHNEPDGVKEQLAAEVVTFINARLSAGSSTIITAEANSKL